MKKLGLNLLLLTAVSVASATKLDVEETKNGARSFCSYEFEGSTFEIAEEWEEHGAYFFKAHVEALEEGLTLQGEISERNAVGEMTVISQPELRVAWEQEGVVTFGDEAGNSLKLLVRAHK